MCIASQTFAQLLPRSPVFGTFVFDQQRGYWVTAIDEVPGRTMGAGLFASADPGIIQKYMPEGSAPASVSTFLLFAGEDTILFDAGLGNDLWISKLTELVKPENVKLVLLTHMHGDHIGGLLNGDARRFPNARVLCAVPEYEHWLPQEGTPLTPQIGRIKTVYAQDLATFQFDDVVFENSVVRVKAIDAVGHTPGHTVFLVESPDALQRNEEKLLILGDLLHAAALQFPVPEVCARFDMDHEKAIASRKRILDFAAQKKIPCVGMHFPPPSIGTVEKNNEGGYEFRSGMPPR